MLLYYIEICYYVDLLFNVTDLRYRLRVKNAAQSTKKDTSSTNMSPIKAKLFLWTSID